MQALNFYPLLDDNLVEQCGFVSSPYKFWFNLNDKQTELEQTGKTVLHISHPNNLWNIENDGLSFEKTISIAYPELLIGKEGVVPQGADVGVCLIWTNSKLTQTGILKPIAIDRSSTGHRYTFSHTFLPGEILGHLELQVSAYVSKSSNHVPSGQEFLMNDVGTLLGDFEDINIDLSNEYLEFPIEEVHEPDQPLWWIRLSDWDDPKTDLFTKENICLYLNTYYPACPLTDGKITNVDLLIEILAQAYLLIFQKVETFEGDMNDIRKDIGLDVNSIGSILHEFIEGVVPPLNFDTPELLLKGLHQEFRNRLKEQANDQ